MNSSSAEDDIPYRGKKAAAEEEEEEEENEEEDDGEEVDEYARSPQYNEEQSELTRQQIRCREDSVTCLQR